MAVEPKINELWSSSTLLRLYDTCELGFCLIDLQGVILETNAALATMLGYEPEELAGMSVFALTHADDQEMTRRRFVVNAPSIDTHEFEKRYIAKNGDVRWVRIRSSGMPDETGLVTCRLVMVDNITSEIENSTYLERMVAMVEQSEDAIFRTDTSGVIQYWSRGAERLYGYRSDEVLNSKASFLLTDANDPRHMDVPLRLLRGEAVLDTFGVTKHKDGHLLNVSVHVFPLLGEDGKVEAFGGIHRDIAKLKLLQEQLRHAQRMETAGLLAGGIAHDFNNILTVIQGASSGLSREIPQESAFWPYLDLIERSSDKARSLTRQLLAFSRRQPIQPKLMEPVPQLQEFLPVLERTIGKGVVLRTVFKGGSTIMQDPTQLEQIVLNLCVNASHAMPGGGNVMLQVDEIGHDDSSLQPRPGYSSLMPLPMGAGRYVRITVSDEGVGMDEALLQHIFEPFFTTRAKGEGTGLGLAVVYGAVSQSGGGLRVDSCPGRGSVFQVFLPVANSKAVYEVIPAPKPIKADKGRILLIEDDPDVRVLIVETLSMVGYELIEAGNPVEVLENPPAENVDLVLTDVVMPKMSGPEFAQHWHQRYPHTRFLYISGYFDESRFPPGFDRRQLLLKPFRATELLERIALQLEARQQGPGP